MAEPGTVSAPRERPLAVLAVLFGLALVAGAFVSVVPLGGGGLDGGALLRERFELRELPFGYEVVEARRIPLGEEYVVLADPGRWTERSAELSARERIEGGGQGPGAWGGGPGQGDVRRGPPAHGGGGHGAPARPGPPGPLVEWGEVPEGEPGTRPAEIVVAWYPEAKADERLARLFGRLHFGDVKDIGEGGGRIAVDTGELAWGAFETRFVRERCFEKVGGTPSFRDAIRVNLTLGRRPCVLFATWPAGMPGSIEPVQEALRALRPEA